MTLLPNTQIIKAKSTHSQTLTVGYTANAKTPDNEKRHSGPIGSSWEEGGSVGLTDGRGVNIRLSGAYGFDDSEVGGVTIDGIGEGGGGSYLTVGGADQIGIDVW
jgi:hypothetical protein